jgi:hypothetical protein
MSTPGCTTNLGLYWNFHLTLLTHTTPSYTLLYDYNIPFSSSSDYKRVSLITFFGVYSTQVHPQTKKREWLFDSNCHWPVLNPIWTLVHTPQEVLLFKNLLTIICTTTMTLFWRNVFCLDCVGHSFYLFRDQLTLHVNRSFLFIWTLTKAFRYRTSVSFCCRGGMHISLQL